jgi:ubiquitin carboxyl-terminal hydrolase 36/42
MAIDGFQKGAMHALIAAHRKGPVTETTWIHKIFGGKTRSRIRCKDYGHISDTLEACLDVSVDLKGVNSLESALEGFTTEETLDLEGNDRYKCEK